MSLFECFLGSFGGYLYSYDLLPCMRMFISSINTLCEVDFVLILFWGNFEISLSRAVYRLRSSKIFSLYLGAFLTP